MKKVISTENAPKAVGPYSQAIEANGFIYISGQVPLVPATGQIVEGGIEEQTVQVMENIKAILEAAGLTFDSVVKTTCLLSDIGNFQIMNGIYAKYFSENPPARAAYEVAKLPLGVMVEIETIAVR